MRKVLNNVFPKRTVKMLFILTASSTITRVVACMGCYLVVETLLSAETKVKNSASSQKGGGGGEPAFQCKEERDIPFGT